MSSPFDAICRLAMDRVLDVMAEPAILHVDGRSVQARGIFQAAYEAVEVDAGVAVSAVQPVLDLAVHDAPVVPEQGDAVTIRGQRYAVVDVRPDEHGFVRLFLHRE